MSRAEERDREREKRTKGEERSEDETVARFVKMELPLCQEPKKVEYNCEGTVDSSSRRSGKGTTRRRCCY